jgi:hypothetical protein
VLARIGGKLALPDLGDSRQISANPGAWDEASVCLASEPVLRWKMTSVSFSMFLL